MCASSYHFNSNQKLLCFFISPSATVGKRSCKRSSVLSRWLSSRRDSLKKLICMAGSCAARSARARRGGRVNAGYAQDVNRHASAAAKPAQLRFGVNPPLGARCGCIHGPGLANPLALAVAIHAAGGAIHQLAQGAAQAQRTQQGLGAGIGIALRVGAGRWRQMHHMRGYARESAQRGSVVKIAGQRRDRFMA